MSLGLSADLDLIRDAAIAAGDRALAMRASGLTTLYKADRSPVTDADLAVDVWLRAHLTAARPGYGWLSEETVDDPARLACEKVFVVDPIDGTRAYIKGAPWWGVSIAIVTAGRPLVGAFRAPDRNETYEAQAGGGARLNGASIRASRTEALEDCRILGDGPLFRHPSWSRPWPPMRVESRNSVAYRLCSVASGEVDAMVALSSKMEWDLAAGDLIAEEAGCVVTDHLGRRLAYNRATPLAPSLLCAGPALHRLILERTEPIDLPS